jgi:hypothetical protein
MLDRRCHDDGAAGDTQAVVVRPQAGEREAAVLRQVQQPGVLLAVVGSGGPFEVPVCGDQAATLLEWLTESARRVDGLDPGVEHRGLGQFLGEERHQPPAPPEQLTILAPSADWGQEMMVSFLGGQAEYDRLYAESGGEKGYAEFVTKWGQTQNLSRTWFDEMIASKPIELIGAYKGDMVVVFGDKDDVVRSGVSEAVSKAYPSASLVAVPDADHGYDFYSDQPEVTALVEKAFADFFAESLK